MARSTSSKSRAQGIQLDYHKQADPILIWKRRLSLVAFLITIFYAVYLWRGGESVASPHLSTGKISFAHASFGNECSQCHVDFNPIALDAWGAHSSTAIASANSKCADCHTGLVGHFEKFLKPQHREQACSTCHDEHGGNNRGLLAIANQQCTRCHQNMAEVAQDSDARVKPKVTAFGTSDGHPEFASLRASSAKVKFSHNQHLMAGQLGSGQRGGRTIDSLSIADQDRYRQPLQDGNALIQLNCGHCHAFTPSSSELVAGTVNKANPQAVSFESHCSACHVLTFPYQSEEHLPLPHGVPWDEMRHLLSAKIFGAKWDRQTSSSASRPSTTNNGSPASAFHQSNSQGIKPAPAAVTQMDRQIVNSISVDELANDVELALCTVRGYCLKCHTDDVIADESIDRYQQRLRTMEPKARWLVYGRFDHSAHRVLKNLDWLPLSDRARSDAWNQVKSKLLATGFDAAYFQCAACHFETYPTLDDFSRAFFPIALSSVDCGDGGATRPDNVAQGAATSNAHPPMIAGYTSCIKCHNEANHVEHPVVSGDTTQFNHWHATTNCVSCHRYHWTPTFVLNRNTDSQSSSGALP